MWVLFFKLGQDFELPIFHLGSLHFQRFSHCLTFKSDLLRAYVVKLTRFLNSRYFIWETCTLSDSATASRLRLTCNSPCRRIGRSVCSALCHGHPDNRWVAVAPCVSLHSPVALPWTTSKRGEGPIWKGRAYIVWIYIYMMYNLSSLHGCSKSSLNWPTMALTLNGPFRDVVSLGCLNIVAMILYKQSFETQLKRLI